MPFEQFVRVVMKNEKGHKTWYLNIQTLQRVLDPPLLQLQGDFNVPEYFDGHAVRWISLWMGHNPGGYNRSQLHNDNHDNLYAVIRGRKHFTIFPPIRIRIVLGSTDRSSAANTVKSSSNRTEGGFLPALCSK